MAYIGNTPADGEFKKADAISSTFNGVLTQFNIDYSSIQQSIGDPSQLIVSLNGVIQEPLTAYTLGIGGGSIIFAAAPVSGDTCHIVILGGVGGTITPSDNSVTPSKLTTDLKDFLEQSFVANGSQTTYTLSRAAAGANTLLLSVDGILQPSSAFSVSGTTLTIDPALPNTTNIRVVHLGVVAGVYVPAANSVTAAMIASSINTDIATGVAALPKAGGAMTGPITTNSTFDGVDIGVRDAILTSTTTTANAALPKAGGTMTGVIAGFESTGIDDNSNATAITIDASENLIIGGTAVGGVTSGTKTYITSTGNLYVASSGEEAAYFNRNSNDGSIVEFRKNNATVGSIGTASSKIYIGSGDAGLYFNKDGNAITPVNTTTVADNDAALDLGTTTARFKDAYLSGGVYLGGTGAANKLDDYEEGNYTVTITMATGTAAVASNSNKLSYTKVGRLVTIGGQFQVGSVSSPGGEFQINLPFTCETSDSGSTNHFHVGTYRTYLIDTPNDGTHPVIYSNPGSAVATLQWSRDQANGTNERATSGGYFMIGFTYMAA